MKINEPVTGREIPMRDDMIIVSKTDLKGLITYANSTFMEIAGFSEAELIGKNHNIVRHPDMPAAAFQDLWDTLQAGKPWTGIVKNRAKNGDHYWVQANVTPLYSNGHIAEYMSVRRRATPEQVRGAELLYAQINQGKLPRAPLWKRFNPFASLKLSHKMIAGGLLLFLLAAIFLGMLVSDRLQQINIAESEIAGLEYIQPLRVLLQNLPQHRGMTNGYLNGDESFKPRILKKQEEIAGNIATLKQTEQQFGAGFDSNLQLKTIIHDWETIQGELFQLESKAAFTRHSDLIAKVINLIVHVGDRSRLILDSQLDRHYLTQMLINKIPPISEYLGRSRGMGSGIAAKGFFGEGQRDTLINLYSASTILFESMDQAVESVYQRNPELKQKLQPLVDESSQSRILFFQAVRDGLLGAATISEDPKEYFAKGTRLIDANFAIFDEVNAFLRTELQVAASALRFQTYLLLAGLLLVTLVIVSMGVVVIREFNRGMSDVLGVFGRMAEGHYFDAVELGRQDELGAILRGLKSMQIKLGYDVNEAREQAAASTRIKTALDNVSSSVMMADNDRNIIYMNKTVEGLFKNAEQDIRKDLPDFDADNLMGTRIDGFHKQPEHQAMMLEKLEQSYSSEINVGGRTMLIVANPVFAENGERMGTAVEWTDRTNEVRVEDELENIVAATLQGDLSKRVELVGKAGFFKHLGQGINALIEQMNRVFDDVATALGRMAEGDLSERINREYSGTFGAVKDNLNNTMDQLRTTIGELRESMGVVRTASNEISSGNTNLSSRTEQQASSLEETASSMEQLTSTVRNNADNAQQANQLARGARESAEQGGAVVQRAIDAMGQINQASGKIAEIIGVIDEIAFQTNLLALNASVEAARAGEQGRGFSVVATEVRNLAGRSATAAKEIKELIQDSVTKVESGSALVNESGETLAEIVGGIKKLGDIVSEIAAASQEQSAGIDQVNQAVTSMDEVTQQNAALAEETSAAATSMNDKASEMDQMMGFFDVALKESSTSEVEVDYTKLDFFAARSAHLAWKHRLRDFLDGKTAMDQHDVASHHDCMLGKWIYEFAMDEFGQMLEMQEMEKVHEQMHKRIKDVVTMKNSGRMGEAETTFNQVGPMSDQVVHLLRRVEDKIDL
ncbi:MAG: methyl-accepting chemotaxis protein [Pseudomonadota bacterium]